MVLTLKKSSVLSRLEISLESANYMRSFISGGILCELLPEVHKYYMRSSIWGGILAKLVPKYLNLP